MSVLQVASCRLTQILHGGAEHWPPSAKGRVIRALQLLIATKPEHKEACRQAAGLLGMIGAGGDSAPPALKLSADYVEGLSKPKARTCNAAEPK
jgi:hypothetical protein